jgi:hypothetical protein
VLRVFHSNQQTYVKKNLADSTQKFFCHSSMLLFAACFILLLFVILHISSLTFAFAMLGTCEFFVVYSESSNFVLFRFVLSYLYGSGDGVGASGPWDLPAFAGVVLGLRRKGLLGHDFGISLSIFGEEGEV